MMSSSKKINVLVVPDLFPKFDGDVQGIFILDYLTATKPWCKNSVLFGKLSSNHKGVLVNIENETTVYRFSVSNKKISKLLKPLYYMRWFLLGYKTGKKFENIDIIHAHGSILSGTLSYLLSKKLNVPFIITEHQGPFSMTSDNFWKRKWTRFIMQKANALLTVSNHLKQEVLNTNINPKQIITTYNPVDTNLFKLKAETAFHNFIFVGRLDNFKGALRCLHAFEKIHLQFPNWTFTIVGDGEDYKAITEFLIQHLELTNKVILKGQLTKVDIAKEFLQADFLVFPSKHESFGLVITEALSAGLPVIVGDKTAPKEFVNHTNGLLVNAYNIEELVQSITQLINTYQTYNSFQIRNAIIEQFGFDNFGKNLVDIYNSTINKH